MKFLLVEEDKIKDNCLTKSHNLSPEQAEFFKDSKIRNADGELLVCSHNSFSKFDSFDKSKIGDGLTLGRGFYFFDNVPTNIPKQYGENQYLCYLNITNPAILDNPNEFSKVLTKLGYSDFEHLLVKNYEITEVFEEFDIDYEEIATVVSELGYDGIWLKDYHEVIAFEPNQIKSITNTHPTNSDNINEDIWNKAGTIYQPKQDSRYKRLIRKPINTLTQEEIKYIFTIHWCWYLANVRRFDYIEDALENTDDRFSEEYFKECYDFLHSLSFPLKVYRAIRDSEHSNDEFTINGKNSSYSWSTNINIYKDATSKFRNCTKIVSCEIDSNVIDVANTINNFIFYTSSHHDRGYGEYEITLKQHFPQSALKNLHWIDKNEINEKLLSESLHRLDSNCFITDSPYDIKNLIMNKPKLYRILYDANIDMYMIGDGYEIVHQDLLEKAFELGYYTELETNKNFHKFIRMNAESKTTGLYAQDGRDGFYNDITGRLEFGPYLIYMVYSPNENEFFLGFDGYESEYKLERGTIFTRHSKLEDCDLYRVLKPTTNAINESFQDEMAVRTLGYECKEDNLPLMDYKEFIELLIEQGMTPSKELYQVYVDAYNYNSVDIEEITTKFEHMSSDDIINLLGIPHSDTIDTSSPMFILPNGSIISVAKAAELIELDFSSNIHSDMVYVILSAIAKKSGQEWTMTDKSYEDRQLDFLTYGLNWARINTGTTWIEGRFYCVLPNHMTSAQYRSLEKWLEWGTDNNKDEVLVYVGRDEVNQTYYFDETFPEDIIKKIKRYYSSGRLYESLLTEEVIDIDVNEAERIATQYVSSSPTYQSWIDTKGRFIDASKLGSHYNLIDEIFWQLSERGKYQNTKPYELSDTEYNKMTDDILDSFAPLGWIQIGLDCQWAGIFRKPNSSQYQSLEEYLDYASHKGVSEFSVNVSTGSDFATASYNLKEVTPEYVVSRIKRFFASGRLYENRNEMKENMNELTKDFSKVVNPKSGDKLTIIDDKDREWNYVAYLWSAPGFISGMAWKGQKGNPWVTDIAANPSAFNSEFPRGVKKVIINNLNEEFVNELVPGELYHFIHNNKIIYGTFKRKTPAWLFFDVEGKEVLAKPWTSVATTTEELEELIGLVDKMEKDTKIPSQVPNRFTRVPNQHNKPMGESNELEQRAKKHKKKSKGRGWHMSFNAGDVETGIEVFNNSTSLGSSGSGEGAAMGEAVEKQLYYYNGPIYYRGHKISISSDIYTTAKSFEEAARNILFKAANGDELRYFDIVDDKIKQMPKGKLERPKCHTCGYELNDMGDCPVCDYGEDDLLESLSSLEALWQLNSIDE